ncbi:hypothetical protein HJC23_005858 [Cyclotella cryptica]|uniref:Uncharacterized protein n=1 Tax=Cyclotella cryptica TaxID=29204 RepID=A0ABD3QZ03_9STRA|eukprot:CCRYP_000375-RA/>CCRYP_000375-RA protein AED:0.09 eAED:-0.05 QI:0/-1/0/1/-1/1/1/0/177
METQRKCYAMPMLSDEHGTMGRSSMKKNYSNDSNHSIEGMIQSLPNVAFSSLEIRSYNITLGDAPSSTGPPISLDWGYDPTSTATYDVDYYESYRSNEAPRRTKSELLMPASHRRELLMSEAGCTRVQIDQALMEARKVVKARNTTRKNLAWQPMQEALENTKRTLGKWKHGVRKGT